jgi:hypothetical protein
MDRPLISSPVEPFASCKTETACDTPPEVKPGVKAFAEFVMKNLGGGNSGYVRACGTKPSGHYTGKAWDWTVSATKSEDISRVDSLMSWLLDNNSEMWKRAGICYLIWNRYRLPNYHVLPESPVYMDWVPYQGINPHTDHVHISFSEAGALGQTSFFAWLNGGQPMTKEPVVVPVSAPVARLGYLFTGFAAGLLAYVYRQDILSAISHTRRA